MRNGKFKGWDPLLFHGSKVSGKTMGIIGTGRIGGDVAKKAKAFGMNIVYYDIVRNEGIEKELGATFCPTPESVLSVADIISIHVPLLDSTHHLLNMDHFKMMKPTAYLINTSRGPVINENDLVEALKKGIIRGAGLDVYEFEPEMAKDLKKLSNVVLTPHIASATEQARLDMARMSADNIIHILEGRNAPNSVYN